MKPKYAEVDGEKFEINTDFRIALKCDEVARNDKISGYERFLAIIYLLFGDNGLNATEKYDRLGNIARQYLLLGKTEKELKSNSRSSKFQLDIQKCKGLIKSSFKYDYGYDPFELDYLHWYDFYNDLENLSTGEFGNCCVLNRVTGTLNIDPSTIKDSKQRSELVEEQERLKEKYCIDTRPEMTEQEAESVEYLLNAIGKEG